MPSDIFSPRWQSMFNVCYCSCHYWVLTLVTANRFTLQSFSENSRLSFPDHCGNPVISWRNGATASKCGISSPVHQSQTPAIFVFFQLPSLFCVKIPVFTLFQRRKVLNESFMSWPEWVVLRGTWAGDTHTVRRCLMKTFGHCRTLVSGQTVDMLPGAEWPPAQV